MRFPMRFQLILTREFLPAAIEVAKENVASPFAILNKILSKNPLLLRSCRVICVCVMLEWPTVFRLVGSSRLPSMLLLHVLLAVPLPF